MINFIQIGAHTGKSMTDIMWWLVPQNNWNGIFVEPVKTSFEKLKEHYSYLTDSIFEQVAIVSGESRSPDAQVKIMLHGKDDFVMSYIEEIDIKKIGIDDEYVYCMTLHDLVAKHNLNGVEFDLLVIDAERQDYQIAMTTDFTIVMPRAIRIETVHINKENRQKLDKYLESFGYEKVKDPWYEQFAELAKIHFPKEAQAEPESFNTTYQKSFLARDDQKAEE